MAFSPDSTPVPQVSNSATVFRSIGGVVDAASTVVTRFVSDMDANLEQIPPVLRSDFRRLCDALYDLDYRSDPDGRN